MRTLHADQERPEDYEWRWSLFAPKHWPIWIWFGFLWVVTRFPIQFVRLLGESVGVLFYNVARGRRRIAERNLELCFPDLSKVERDRICRDSFKGMGCTLFECGLVWWSRPERLYSLTQVENVEVFRKGIDSDKPLLLVSMHNTCLEMSYAAVVKQTPFNVIYRIQDNPVFEFLSGRGRLRFPVRLIGRKNIRAFLTSLHNNEVALMVPDQDLGKRGAVFVPFFGIPTAWVTSAADVAKRTSAIVQFFSVRRDWSQKKPYIVTLSEPLDNFPSDSREQDMALISSLTQQAIELDPSQYLWAHRRFKSRPNGEPSLYLKK